MMMMRISALWHILSFVSAHFFLPSFCVIVSCVCAIQCHLDVNFALQKENANLQKEMEREPSPKCFELHSSVPDGPAQNVLHECPDGEPAEPDGEPAEPNGENAGACQSAK